MCDFITITIDKNIIGNKITIEILINFFTLLNMNF